MRLRKQDENGDMTFGRGRENFLVDSPELTAQLCGTRLRLQAGEWFLDSEEGTPWSTQILGYGTMSIYDAALRRRLLKTSGVKEIVSYNSAKDENRRVTVAARLSSIFGIVDIVTPL